MFCVRHARVLSILVVACIAPTSLAPAAEELWKAGMSRVVITPKEPMWMSGYAGRNHAAEGTLHDLWCKTLVVEDGTGNRAAFISLDLVGISRSLSQRICVRLQKNHGLARAQICLATSHTHTGPVVDGNLNAMYFLDKQDEQRVVDYGRFLEETVVREVANAIAALRPATLRSGIGHIDFAVNRRENREADVPTLRANGMLKGPVDHDVPVITVHHGDKLSGILFGYACHATTLSFYQWSGDWPGFGQIELEKMFPGTTAMFFAGCGADQNPLPRRTVELAEKYGQQIAAAVRELITDEQMPAVAPRLATRYREVRLPFAEPLKREQLIEQQSSSNKYVVGRANLLLRKLKATGKPIRDYAYPVQVWQFGDKLDFVMLGGEVVVDYSLKLKDRRPDRTVFVGAYMNDVMAYIPSERVLTEGGYEGAGAMVYYGLPSAWAGGLEKRILEAAFPSAPTPE